MFREYEMTTAMQARVPTQATLEGVPLQGITREANGSFSKPAEIHVDKRMLLQVGMLAGIAATGAPADMGHAQVHLGPINLELDSFGIQTAPALATTALGFLAGATRAFRMASSKRYEARINQTNKEIKDVLANQKFRLEDGTVTSVAEQAAQDVRKIAAAKRNSYSEKDIVTATQKLIDERIHDDYMKQPQRCEKVNKWHFAFSEGMNAAVDMALGGVAISDWAGFMFGGGSVHWTRPLLLTALGSRGLYEMLGRNQQDVLMGKTTVGNAFDLDRAA